MSSRDHSVFDTIQCQILFELNILQLKEYLGHKRLFIIVFYSLEKEAVLSEEQKDLLTVLSMLYLVYSLLFMGSGYDRAEL